MGDKSRTGNKILANLFWRYAERCGAQLVQFIVSIVLARLIAPEAFGTIAIVLVFTNLLQVFVDSGIGNALIQKNDTDELDFSTVFYFNILWCLLLYLVLYLAASPIASFYKDNSLIPVIRVLGLVIIISGLKNVQQAYVSKTLQFKKFFFATLGGTLVSAIAGIALAIQGYGVWALVAQKLVNISIDTCVLYFTVKWRPKLLFSFERLKYLFGYAWKLLASSLLDFLYLDFQQLIIGKLYSSSVLAFYSRGKQFPNLIVANINTSIDSVLFPVMSMNQGNKKSVKAMLQMAIKTSTYIMAPLMIGLFVMAPTLISVVLTDAWLECVPFLRVFCLTYMFQPIHTSNMNSLKAMGRTDILLKIEVIKKIFCVSVLVVTMFISVEAILIGLLACSIVTQIINAWPNRRLLNYGYLEQLKDILPGILLAVFMGGCITPISLLSVSKYFILLIQVISGGAIFIGVSALCKNETFMYLKNIAFGASKKV